MLHKLGFQEALCPFFSNNFNMLIVALKAAIYRISLILCLTLRLFKNNKQVFSFLRLSDINKQTDKQSIYVDCLTFKDDIHVEL